MCGIIGILGKSPVNQAIYDGLLVLQHRGQDAAGILTCDDNRIHLRKDNGQVRDVFQERHMLGLKGNMGIGHVRYPTAGCDSPAEAQPFYVNSPYGLALAHNGNLTNAVTMLVMGFGILAFRDPYGIRPLVYGKRETEQGTEYMFASESVALDVVGFDLVRDVAPGECIVVDVNGQVHSQQCAEKPLHAPCIFEFVYMARPDSMMDGIYVHKTRLRMGERLANKIKRVWPDHDIDVVIPIPDTSRTAALQMAYELDLPYREGFIQT